MFFRPTRETLSLVSVALLLLEPSLLGGGHASTAYAGPAERQHAGGGSGFESHETPGPDDEPYGDPATPPPSSNKPPVIRNFTHTVQGTVVIFTGTVVDENPSGLTVRFGGPSSMDNLSITTDTNGNFTLSVNMGGQTGEVWARATDAQGLDSVYAYDTVR